MVVGSDWDRDPWSEFLATDAAYGRTTVVVTSKMARTLVPSTTNVGAMSLISSPSSLPRFRSPAA